VVYVVAVIALARAVEEEAPLLAVDLGVTTYEAALALRAPSPSVVLRAEDRARALAVLAKLRERGHEAVALDAAMVVSSEAMTAVRSFRFEPDALIATGPGGDERLPYSDVLALVRATHATRETITEKSRERQISVGRLAMSGGLMPTKVVEKTSTRRNEEREPILYLFRRDAAKPWIVRASRTRYEGLGAELRPVGFENFQTLVRKLAALAPGAALDERLLAVRTSADASTAEAIDLLAHLVAIAIARRTEPYRAGA
jgi:hypothetical protein